MFQCCDLSGCWLEDSKNLHIGHVGVHTDVVRTVWWRLLGQVMNWHCLNWPKTVQIGNLPCKRAEGKFMSDTSHGLFTRWLHSESQEVGGVRGPPLGVLKGKFSSRNDQVRSHATCFGPGRMESLITAPNDTEYSCWEKRKMDWGMFSYIYIIYTCVRTDEYKPYYTQYTGDCIDCVMYIRLYTQIPAVRAFQSTSSSR